MENFLLFAVLGLGSGALFAGLALSVLLSYRGAGVVNLAAGAIAILGAYVFFDLRTNGDLFLPPIPFAGDRLDLGGPWSTGPAIAVALAVCALTGTLFDGIVLRRLRNSSPLAKLIATLGLLLTLQALIQLRFGSDGQAPPTVLSNDSVSLFGTEVGADRLQLAAIVLVVALVLALVYRYTRFGVATRAAQEDEGMAMLYRLSPNLLSMVSVVLAFVLAGAIGIFAAPTSQLDPIVIPLAVIPALGAAVLARFTNFIVAAVAGLALGVIQSLVVWLATMSWFPTIDGLPIGGVDTVIFFVLLLVVVFLRGGSLPERGTVTERRLPEAPRPARIVRPAVMLSLLAATMLIYLPSDYRLALIFTIIGTLMCLSLVVLTGFAGQISLMQMALAGVTALVVTKLGSGAGIGFPLGPLLGVLAAVALGLIAALPALRARGVMLAVVTMAAAVALSSFWFANPSWGFDPLATAISPPSIFGLDLGTRAAFPLGSGDVPSPVFGFLCLAATVAAGMLVASLRRAELGQRFLAVRANEAAAASAGINVRETKLVAYAIASMLAGVGGALYAYSFGVATSDRYSVWLALTFIAYAYIGGITSVRGAILGGLLFPGALIGLVMDSVLGISPQYQLVFAGLALIVMVIQTPAGLASLKLPPWLRRLGPSPPVPGGAAVDGSGSAVQR